MPSSVPQPREDSAVESVDVVVVGSGAGGLAAAVTAAEHGLKVLVLEKAEVYGGTTAWSGGWMWIPRNPLAVAAGIQEDLDGPRRYLRHELGPHYDEARVAAFLAQGPRMVEFFQQRTALAFIDGNAIPDFHGHSPGAREGGRSVCAAPYDLRELGPQGAALRPPLDLISLWGMGIASGAELRHFLNAMRSWPSFCYVARRVGRHLWDLLRHGRGQRLVNGNALVARLARSAFDRGVEIRVNSPVQRLCVDGGRVTGVVCGRGGQRVTVQAKRGVVLASGGFPHDPQRMAALCPQALSGQAHPSAAPATNTGDGLRMAEAVGADLQTELAAAAGWAPVSEVRRADGSVGRFPHLIERAKPGLIAVNRAGQRFVNEAGSYHDFMSALFAVTPAWEPVEAWLLCDHRFIRRYGLGHAKPAPMPLGPSLRSGYLRRGRSIAALAQACGLDAAALQATVAAYNRDASEGRDTAFGRGSTPYNRAGGDAGQQPNPNVAPLRTAPFYAVKVLPGSLGTFAGLRTDASARVLGRDGQVLAGLYACGADMASVMGGRYPSGGITLGPAMTFGHLAGLHLAGIDPSA